MIKFNPNMDTEMKTLFWRHFRHWLHPTFGAASDANFDNKNIIMTFTSQWITDYILTNSGMKLLIHFQTLMQPLKFVQKQQKMGLFA